MFPHIPKARPAPVDDRTLATLTQIAHGARTGDCSPAEAEWLLTTAAALLEELACRRATDAARTAGATIIALPVGGR